MPVKSRRFSLDVKNNVFYQPLLLCLQHINTRRTLSRRDEGRVAYERTSACGEKVPIVNQEDVNEAVPLQVIQETQVDQGPQAPYVERNMTNAQIMASLRYSTYGFPREPRSWTSPRYKYCRFYNQGFQQDKPSYISWNYCLLISTRIHR